jgi:hypothetical protein
MATKKATAAKKTAKKDTTPVVEPTKEPIPTGDKTKVEAAKEMSEAMDKVIEPSVIPPVNEVEVIVVSKENAEKPFIELKKRLVSNQSETLEKVIASLEHQFNNGVMMGKLQEDIALLKSL